MRAVVTPMHMTPVECLLVGGFGVSFAGFLSPSQGERHLSPSRAIHTHSKSAGR